MWKIKYLGSGYYSIRPMHKLDMGLNADTSDVNLIEIGTSDFIYGVTANARWTITFNTNGYVLKRGGSNARALIPYANVTTADSFIVAATYSASVAAQRWDLQKLTSPPQGIIFYDIATKKPINFTRIFVAQGQTKQLTDLGIEVAVYSPSTISQAVTWETLHSELVNVDENTGAVTGNGFSSGNQNYTIISANSTNCSASGSIEAQCIDVEFFGFQSYFDEDTFGYQTADTLVEYIPNAVRFIDVAYYKQFGVTFHSASYPMVDVTSGIDDCTASRDCSADSGCASSCSAHHKNATRIYKAYRYGGLRNDNGIMVLWTNFPEETYCEEAYCVDTLSNRHTPDSSMASVKNYYPFIHVKRVAGANVEEMEACMAITLAHETAHCFNFEDANGYEQDGHDIDHAYVCVMERYESDADLALTFYLSVVQGKTSAFCSSCENYLKDHVNSSGLDWFLT